MRRWTIAGGVVVAVLAASSTVAFAQEAESGKPDSAEVKLPNCPVMDEPVDFNIKVDTDDGPVYFCCKKCIKKFKKDPAPFAEKVAMQRESLKKMPRVQVACPLTGKPVDKKQFVETNGEKVYFCCGGCVGKYKADPAKYAAKLEGSYTYQTHCPVMGEEIDPAAFVDLPTGERIYLCCPGCGKKIQDDPEKYAPKLAAQGININVEKLKAGAKKKAGP